MIIIRFISLSFFLFGLCDFEFKIQLLELLGRLLQDKFGSSHAEDRQRVVVDKINVEHSNLKKRRKKKNNNNKVFPNLAIFHVKGQMIFINCWLTQHIFAQLDDSIDLCFPKGQNLLFRLCQHLRRTITIAALKEVAVNIDMTDAISKQRKKKRKKKPNLFCFFCLNCEKRSMRSTKGACLRMSSDIFRMSSNQSLALV
jgi:hypothetical protein